jgi:hypothetical protein
VITEIVGSASGQFVLCSNMSENLNRGKQLDRRISAAPMMDWTDAAKIPSWRSGLDKSEIACRLYVASVFSAFCNAVASKVRQQPMM